MLRSGNILLFKHAPTAFLDVFVTRIGAIVKTAEDLVPGCFVGAVVAIELTVMQLVHEVTELERKIAGQLDLMITTV